MQNIGTEGASRGGGPSHCVAQNKTAQISSESKVFRTRRTSHIYISFMREVCNENHVFPEK